VGHVIHTIPINDLITHVTDGSDCPCGPTVIPIERADGSMAFQYVHHSLDGREFAEKQDGEPSFTCPICRMTSYNENDIYHGYCGNCHAFTRGSVLVEMKVADMASNNWEWMPLPLKVIAVVILVAVACGLVWLIFYGEI
jgi:hypothetical protein